MSRIRVINFGPIKQENAENGGWIDIKKVTVFIGNQGSGKSTLAKLISSFMWMEKALMRDIGDVDAKWLGKKNRLQDFFLKYHNIESYLSEETVIEYEGAAYSIRYEKYYLSALLLNDNTNYSLPQIMYVPAERNFIAYVKTPKELRLSSDSLQEFLTEFENAKADMKEPLHLPINNVSVVYDHQLDILSLKGSDYRIRLNEASSGFQSLVPLYVVSDYLARSVKEKSENSEKMNDEERQQFKKGFEQIWNNNTLTDEQKRIAVSALSARFNKTAFINIIEEPEQNLFPASQWQMLKSLLGYNNMNANNKLIVTSHSPYVINYLNISIQAEELFHKIVEAKKEDTLLPKLFDIIPTSALTAASDVVVYELNEANGCVKKLAAPGGIPSDKNYLNNMLREGNNLFDTLLSIEEEL
ncbi:putative AbiEii toxin of type IV toxin-antitoxin system [Chitinophaga skermanii]|uniref:Putative AbiEii toxin of type IV toxin-antitoxin system n=1 Tax=Chitinophaga skermanii TaxID=331697 RepID=A0A327QL15_9BACT|nr:AAA family ATPase [Chitinophaga skermanii]RAJ05356.1 putative AbiEii toxin of type IV toxin-antitoxin system [Chitinophaga skermanii]